MEKLANHESREHPLKIARSNSKSWTVQRAVYKRGFSVNKLLEAMFLCLLNNLDNVSVPRDEQSPPGLLAVLANSIRCGNFHRSIVPPV